MSAGKRAPLTEPDGEVGEITDEDMKFFVRVADFASLEEAERAASAIAAARDADTVATAIPLDGEVLAHFRALGPDWRERINAALRKAAGL